MKLKSALKVVNSTKISITVETSGKFKTYDINYLSGDARIVIYDGPYLMKLTARSGLPADILEREVTYIDAFDGRVDISCYERAKKRSKEVV